VKREVLTWSPLYRGDPTSSDGTEIGGRTNWAADVYDWR
jgi:hypothetical protein